MPQRIALVALLAFVTGSAMAGDQKTPRVLIELFTSQGCSSCPPADAVLSELSEDPSVVALSMPVDYWDYLGWKDTLARPAFTHRQKAYAEQRGDRQVYTPQAVINGISHAVGSDRAAVEHAMRAVHTRDSGSVPIALAETGETLRVAVGAGPGLSSGSVWLLPLTRKAKVTITRGENKGQSVTYCNVVRAMTRLGDWDGKAVTFDVSLPHSVQAPADSYAVVLQAGTAEKPGTVLGAAIRRP